MRSISMCWPGCCSPPSNLPAPTKRRRGARRGPPSFKDAAERLAEALAATREAEAKLAQARRRVEAAQRRRSDERRVGKESVSQCRSRWSPENEEKKHTKTRNQENRVT